ncbi:hypothetical protein JCGZ_15010 [Jatropha curcas]|uniref:Leucine-rich repeat-containing N-terminal plant-type domain-containing protein n=1 Tax=Jatropha curcas TaxID=180498 RepID=A0A067KHF2_JATCU|nr:hypothetical protein JCGZ_15010 [Jatropha curcas]
MNSSYWKNQIIFLVLLNFHCQLALSSPISSYSAQSCLKDESTALLQLKQEFYYDASASIDCEPPRPKMGSWEVRSDCCFWDGVTCDNVTGYVIGLDLSCSGLNGDLTSNSSLFSLSNLQSLNLAFNDFNRSSIPPEFGSFKKLTFLNLSSTWFSGPVPFQISHLSNLVSLDLSENEPLTLETPTMKMILENLTQQLMKLDLSNNNWTGKIPDVFEKLKDINHLSVSNSNFSGMLPSSIFNLTKLYWLDLSQNNLEGSISNQLCGFSKLIKLDLSYNLLSGIIPSCVYGLPSLVWFSLSFNQLTGQLGEFRSKSLLEIVLESNKIYGPIHPSVFELTNLTNLHLPSNNLSGVVNLNMFSKLKNLWGLDLSNNHFSVITSSINNSSNSTNCKMLQVLDLSNNKINDSFPEWLATLPDLQVFVLRSNRFHGLIGYPEGNISPFPKLRIIDISYNEFSGHLPTKYFSSLQSMKKADKVNKKANYMGEIYYQDSVVLTLKGIDLPIERILTIFTAIDLSSNRFDGAVVDVIGNLSSLVVLNFSHNSLTGQIPSSLGNLKELESLDLSSNQLIGSIPEQLTNLNFLAKLNLSYNQLEGPIPQGKQFGYIVFSIRKPKWLVRVVEKGPEKWITRQKGRRGRRRN